MYFIIGCLLNCTIFFNIDLFLSLFIKIFTNFIKNLYPSNANLLLFISTLNELYNFELIVILYFFMNKYFIIFIFILFFTLKNFLFFHEFLYFFVFSIYFYSIFLFSLFFFSFFSSLFLEQSTNIYNLIEVSNIKINFNINLINEINYIEIYILLFTLIIFYIHKNISLIFFLIYPFFIYLYLFFFYLFYFFMNARWLQMHRKGRVGFEPTINYNLY
jgi:hypothetical protein